MKCLSVILFAFAALASPTPSAITPADKATGASINTRLDWPDAEPGRCYEVLLGTRPDRMEVLVETDTSEWEFYEPLEPGTTYYWQVIDFDGPDEHEGPVWEFETEDAK